jgi:hypothetical protein
VKYLPIISILFLAGCSTGNNNRTTDRQAGCDTLTPARLKTDLLGKDLSHLPAYRCFVARDTTLEGDEGIQWKGKAFYIDSELVFLAEANWQDARKVHRITIVGSQVKEGGLFVDQRFADIKGMVSDKIPTSPDGYLFLTYKKDTAISIQLDIAGASSDSPLFNGVSGLDKVPDTLRVESIVIM